MDTYKRAGRAHKSASKQALRELGVPEPGLKAAGARQRRMPRPKVVKGRTLEEQQRIDVDNAAMAAAARRREQALRQEQKARRQALEQALRQEQKARRQTHRQTTQALAQASVPAANMHAKPNTQALAQASVPAANMHTKPDTHAHKRAGKRTQNTPPRQASMRAPGASG